MKNLTLWKYLQRELKKGKEDQEGKLFFLPSWKLQKPRKKRWRETKMSPKQSKWQRIRRGRLYREGLEQGTKKDLKEKRNSHPQSISVVGLIITIGTTPQH